MRRAASAPPITSHHTSFIFALDRMALTLKPESLHVMYDMTSFMFTVERMVLTHKSENLMSCTISYDLLFSLP